MSKLKQNIDSVCAILFKNKYGGFIMRKELRIGFLLQGIFLIINRFLNTPDLISGLLMGLSLLYLIIGIMPGKVYVKIKEIKNGGIKSTS